MKIKIPAKVIEEREIEVPDQCIEDAKKMIGAPPYHGGSNVVRGDGYFQNACVNKYGAEVWQAACKHVGDAWRRHVAEFKA